MANLTSPMQGTGSDAPQGVASALVSTEIVALVDSSTYTGALATQNIPAEHTTRVHTAVS